MELLCRGGTRSVPHRCFLRWWQRYELTHFYCALTIGWVFTQTDDAQQLTVMQSYISALHPQPQDTWPAECLKMFHISEKTYLTIQVLSYLFCSPDCFHTSRPVSRQVKVVPLKPDAHRSLLHITEHDQILLMAFRVTPCPKSLFLSQTRFEQAFGALAYMNAKENSPQKIPKVHREKCSL